MATKTKDELKALMREHFERLMGALQSVDCPELSLRDAQGNVLEGEMVRLWFRPVQALGDMADQFKAGSNRGEYIAQKFIDRVLDSEGNRIYTRLDRFDVMKFMDSEFIARIVGYIDSFDSNSVHAESLAGKTGS